jgi:hypothetical protein
MADLKNVSLQHPLPVDQPFESQVLISMPAEAVVLKYWVGNVLTVDAGQPAGTPVVGKLLRGGILSAVGDTPGYKGNSSLVVTSTALTTEVFRTYEDFYSMKLVDGGQQLADLVKSLKNGEYIVDYQTGTIYGKKADNSVAVSVVYNVSSPLVTTVPPGPSSDVNVVGVSGVAVTLGQKAMGSSFPVVIASDQGSIPTVAGANTTLLAGQKSVALVATPEPVTAIATAVKSVVIQAKSTNTAVCSVGNAAAQYHELYPGDAVSIDIDDLNKIYIKVSVNGEGINYLGTV